MARGDGKAVRGRTKGSATPRYSSKGVRKMAFGGKPGESAEARSEAARAGSSPSGGVGASSRDGGMRGPAGGNMGGSNNGGGNRQTSTPSKASSRPSGASPAGQMARLGSNPSAAMTQAGIDSGRAQMLSGIYNDLSQPTKERAIRGTSVNSLTPGGKIADRIEPTMGYISQPNLSSVPKAPQAPTGRVPGYIDQQSIVPGSVSFKQASKFTPFAQTPTGQELLAMSKKPLTAEQAKALKDKFPPGSSFYAQPGKGMFDLQNVAAAQYPAPANLSGLDTYPATIGGYKFNVGIPKNAGVNDPYGPKIGQYNPGPVAKATKPINDRIPQTGGKQYYDRIAPEGATAARPASAVVAAPARGKSPMPSARFGEGRKGDDRPIRKKKKPITEEGTTAAKNGGLISRGDGKASRGKTKGRYI